MHSYSPFYTHCAPHTAADFTMISADTGNFRQPSRMKQSRRIQIKAHHLYQNI